ncbi:Zn-dependent peptidase ImmA, M78 family [Hathewaya proteolytica DSM 3090]|uniref:Zn-dependent peptidase ImmA, M78 family n=1 Tax=Hathewaya proteolytica DSM 3090 TaxID=1121331 RepID=A0A1M6SXK0_9CLOT|nr:ImmA/IrrE family metallo-endopeptidase [Hathewaya proteolytica]SHK49380.1 Zn-dependent peptidase ImmA, M78 family [Hathewaya proteolytica DSM 3090]
MKSSIELNSNALKMRKILNEDSSSPMDIFSLINNLKDVTLIFYPMSDRISGMCIREKNSKIIAVNSNMSYGRQRFTAAHELYHLFFEEKLRSIVCEKNINQAKSDSEKEADIFASYLLAPYDSLRSYLEENNMLDNDILTIEDVINMEQFYQVSHQAMLYRLVYDEYMDWNTFNNIKMAVSQKAMRLGYDDKLYKASPEEKKYFSIGEYVKKVEELKGKDLISNGKYEELLLDAFRSDIVYNLGSEGIELND